MTRRFFAVVTLCVGLTLTACSAPAPKEKIQIGVVLSQTGSLGGKGPERLEAIQMAVDEINAAGGVLGKTLELVSRDDGTDKVKGKAAAEELADAGVTAIIGPAGSAIALEVITVTAAAKIVQISGSATSPALTSAADDGFFFRTIPSDALQGRLLGKRAYSKSVTAGPLRRAAIIHVPGAYGAGLRDAFQAQFTASGGTVTAVREYMPGQASYMTLLGEVYATNPDGVVLIGYSVEGATIIREYKSTYASRGTFWFFPDGLADPSFVTAAAPLNFNHEGTAATTPAGATFDAYQAAFKAKYSRDPNPTLAGQNYYDAVYLLALSMQAAGKKDGAAVRDALPGVSKGGTAYGPGDFKKAVEALGRGEDIDYEGVSGPLNFDDVGDVVGPYDVWNASTGSIVAVERAVSP